jgi:hypothetical protein
VSTLTTIAARLTDASLRAAGTHRAPHMPDAVDLDQWFMSPELISLYGTPWWDRLDEMQRRRLSRAEAINFFSLNIHGEAALLAGLESRDRTGEPAAVTAYLEHLIAEERVHSTWFREACAALQGDVLPARTVTFPRDHAPGEATFLLFARIVIFEEIVDVYNAAMARDPRLAPLARDVNAAHHADERRHLAFGRRLLAELWQTWSARWDEPVVAGIRAHLRGYLTATWRNYYSPDAYAECGFSDPASLAREVWEHPAAQAHRSRCSTRCLHLLDVAGIVPDPLRRFVVDLNPERDPATLDDSTALIRERWLSSLQLPELLLLLEELRGRPIDPATLTAGAFRDLRTIRALFLDGAA